MSTRCVSCHQECSWGVKAAGGYGWQPTTITVPLSRKLGALTLLDPSGPSWPVGTTLPFLLYKLRIDKLHSSDTENSIQKIPEHCSCSETSDAWGTCVGPGKWKSVSLLQLTLPDLKKRFSLLSLGPVTTFLWRTYSYFVLYCNNSGPGHLIFEVTRSHTIRHTPGKTPPNRWSVRSTGRYLQNTQ